MRTRRVVLAGICLAMLAPAARAQGGVRVAPVVIDIPQRGVSSLRVTNARDTEMAFEIEAFAWSQENGADVLTPTRELIAAPSVFAAPAGGEQIVRLALAPGAAVGAAERTYRLILRELPRPDAPGFRVRLELSLPVFATPPNAGPLLDARRGYDSEGGQAAIIINRGDGHARITGFYAPDLVQSPRYLLAGARFTAPLAPGLLSVRIAYARGAAITPTEETFTLAAPTALADLR